MMTARNITRRGLTGTVGAALAALATGGVVAGGAMRKVWIEVALNGSWGRAVQPGIPEKFRASSMSPTSKAIWFRPIARALVGSVIGTLLWPLFALNDSLKRLKAAKPPTVSNAGSAFAPLTSAEHSA